MVLYSKFTYGSQFSEEKNSAKRDTRPLKGMFNSPIYVHVGGDLEKEIFERRLGKKFGTD